MQKNYSSLVTVNTVSVITLAKINYNCRSFIVFSLLETICMHAQANVYEGATSMQLYTIYKLIALNEVLAIKYGQNFREKKAKWCINKKELNKLFFR